MYELWTLNPDGVYTYSQYWTKETPSSIPSLPGNLTRTIKYYVDVPESNSLLLRGFT